MPVFAPLQRQKCATLGGTARHVSFQAHGFIELSWNVRYFRSSVHATVAVCNFSSILRCEAAAPMRWVHVGQYERSTGNDQWLRFGWDVHIDVFVHSVDKFPHVYGISEIIASKQAHLSGSLPFAE